MVKRYCWKDRGEWAEEAHGHASDEYAEAYWHPGTCMLSAGHDGPHVWTDDGDIVVTFPEGGGHA